MVGYRRRYSELVGYSIGVCFKTLPLGNDTDSILSERKNLLVYVDNVLIEYPNHTLRFTVYRQIR